MTGHVVRPTRLASQDYTPRVSARATSTKQSVRMRPAQPSVTPRAAVQHGVTSPSPAGRVATEDVGQRRVGGERSLLLSSDNRPAGSVVLPPLNVLEEEGGNTNASAPATEETTQGADARVILDAHIDVRVTRTELGAVKREARKLGVKPSKWVRAVLRDALDARSHEEEALAAYAAVPMPSPEKARAVEQMRRAGVNLNQALRTGAAVTDELLRDVLAAHDDLRAAFGDEVSL
ncbi:hypothetical protein [uncultured Actinomyces sp.]|uniref:hypothetical protein n=1 Tax=uncultured Actinomyces sp. TaxID=249061 RepID=UPI002619D509|nr:hypothetical protein [uncultured Actinomyces sp.]